MEDDFNFDTDTDSTNNDVNLKILNSEGFTSLDKLPGNIHHSKEFGLIKKDIGNFFFKNFSFNKVILGDKAIGKTVSLRELRRQGNLDSKLNNLKINRFIKKINSSLLSKHIKELKLNFTELDSTTKESVIIDNEKIDDDEIIYRLAIKDCPKDIKNKILNEKNYKKSKDWINYNNIIYVNCKNHSSKKAILKEIILNGGGELVPKIAIESQFRTFFKNMKIVLIIDEVDFITKNVRHKTSIFTDIILNANDVDMSLIMITNKFDWLDIIRKEDLDFKDRIFIEREDKLKWDRPNCEEINKILTYRFEEFTNGNLDDKEDVIQSIAGLTYSKYGSNMRVSIRTLYAILKKIITNEEYETGEVMKEQVLGLLIEGIENMLDAEFLTLYISMFTKNSTELYNVYKSFVELEGLLIPKTKPSVYDNLTKIYDTGYINLYNSKKVKQVKEFDSKIDKELIIDEFIKRFKEDSVKHIAIFVAELNKLKRKNKNKTLLD